MQGLLELAFSYTDTTIVYEQIDSHRYDQLGQQQLVALINRNQVSVMWSGTSVQLEQQLQPIRIPLYKGLLGHRLLLVRRGDTAKFTSVTSLQQLRELRLGQGAGWPDTSILQNAGMRVVTSGTYHALFEMLNQSKFDAFPRGLQEPWAEMQTHRHMDLDIEQDLMLVYKLPSYFFVRQGNRQLARTLEQGLEKAIAEKTFDDYFHYSPQIMDAIEKSAAVGRIVMELENPFLPPETPLHRKELWLDIVDL